MIGNKTSHLNLSVRAGGVAGSASAPVYEPHELAHVYNLDTSSSGNLATLIASQASRWRRYSECFPSLPYKWFLIYKSL